MKPMNRYWATVLGIILVGSVAVALVGTPGEMEHIWDLSVFFAFYGFVGCVVIIYASKAIGKLWLQRSEDYYEPYRAPTEVGEAFEDSRESKAEGDATDA